MQECYEFDEGEGDLNVEFIKNQTWIIDPKDADYNYTSSDPVPELPEDDFEDTEFIIRATCSELVLDHDAILVSLTSCIEGDNDCYNFIKKY
jgi:hypothetical protein